MFTYFRKNWPPKRNSRQSSATTNNRPVILRTDPGHSLWRVLGAPPSSPSGYKGPSLSPAGSAARRWPLVINPLQESPWLKTALVPPESPPSWAVSEWMAQDHKGLLPSVHLETTEKPGQLLRPQGVGRRLPLGCITFFLCPVLLPSFLSHICCSGKCSLTNRS